MNLGRLTPNDLILLLTLIPRFEDVVKDGQANIREKSDRIFTPQSASASWHHLYELPYPEHLAHLIVGFGLTEDVAKMAATENPPQACLAALEESFESDGFNWELDKETRALLPLILGVTFSLYLSFKSLLTFGLYLNELIAIAAKGGAAGDKALFQAMTRPEIS